MSSPLPPVNPSLIQASVYPSVHFDSAQTDVTSLPAWTNSATIERSEVAWLPSVPFIGTAHLPYPDGEQALFISGTSRASKIRITDGDFSVMSGGSIGVGVDGI